MAVNLIDSNDIQVAQTGNNIELQIDDDIKNSITQNTSDIGDAQQEIDDLQTYSSSEIVIGTYNNKPVYRKISDTTQSITGGGAYMDQGNYTILSGVTNIDALLKFEGYLYDSGSPTIRPCNQAPFNSINERNSAVISNRTEGIILGRTAWSSNRQIFILEYTKTTD